MTVWTHNESTLFRRAHVTWALLRQVLLDGYASLFSRSNSLLRSPCHLHVPGYPAFQSCSVFSVSIRVLVLIYAHVLSLSIYSSSSPADLFFIFHHWAHDVTSIIRTLRDIFTNRKTCAHFVYHILCFWILYVRICRVFLSECTYVLLDLLPELWTLWRTIPDRSGNQQDRPLLLLLSIVYYSLKHCAVSYFMNSERTETEKERVRLEARLIT